MDSSLRAPTSRAALVTTLLAAGLAVFARAGGVRAAPHGRTFQQVFAEATAAREAGRLEATARLLREAYAIAPTPALLNNLGRVLETLGRYDEAADAYARVVDDPTADAQLRALDAARLAKLERRLGAAWVVASVEPEGAVLLVDGRPPGAAVGREFRLDSGDHVFEVLAPGGARARLIVRRFPLNRRSEVHLRVTPPPGGPPWVRLMLDGPAAAPDGLAVDGYRLQGPMDHLREVLVAPGRHRVRVERADGRVATGRFMAAPGETVSLGALAPPPALGVRLTQPAPAASGSPWPWVMTGVGGVGLATGVGLYLAAQGNLDTIDAARRDEAGNVVGLTYAEAKTLQAAAADKRTAALAASVAGGALLVGGLLWGILDGAGDGPPEVAEGVRLSLSLGGAVVSGSF